jgi:hypothetical protein
MKLGEISRTKNGVSEIKMNELETNSENKNVRDFTEA